MDPFFARNRLSAYLDGELPSAEAREVEEALAESAELRAELASLSAAIALLRRGGPVPAPEGFAQRVEARIATEPLRVGWRRHLHGFRIEVGMLAAAAVVVLVFAARKPEAPEGEDSVASGEASTVAPPPAVDIASVPMLEKAEPSTIGEAPEADGLLAEPSFARRELASKRAEGKESSIAPTKSAPTSTAKSKARSSSSTTYEREPYSPAWEQTPEVPEPPPTVQAVAGFQFRLKAHGDTGLRDLAALAASLGGKLTDARGKELAPYPMESGDSRTVKLVLPSVNAGAVAARLYEYGDIEVISLSGNTLYASGATVPVVIEVTAP